MNYLELRNKYPTFTYESFSSQLTPDGLAVEFNFNTSDQLYFTPKILIQGVTREHLDKMDQLVFDKLIFHLGMIETLSYWKATCSPQIVVKAGYLDSEQIAWWKDLLVH